MSETTQDSRIVSLDAFRGMTIAGMILVNNPGSWAHVYPPLRHAEWHGWTPTDLVFPFFLFIVGVALAYSFAKQLEANTSIGKASLYTKVVRRTVLIFAIGLFLNFVPDFDFSTLRIAGVLQRIAVVYGITAIVVLHSGLVGQAVIAVALLIIYWLLMTYVPVPGHGPGLLEPTTNLAAHIDSLYLPGRKYQITWDPEGLLSTIPAVSTALFGVLTGYWLRSGRDRSAIAGGLLLIGAGMTALGLLLDQFFPINKHIWTSSYVVFTAGAAQLLLAICYWLIDVRGYRRVFFPAIVFGVNPIAVYFLSGLAADALNSFSIGTGDAALSAKNWIFTNLFLSWASPLNASLAFAIVYVSCWFAAMYLLYRNRIFIKI